jgi:hypothetical protein
MPTFEWTGDPAGGPYQVFTGDFNGDGKCDIGLRKVRSGELFFLLGDGAGRFDNVWPAFQWTGDPAGGPYQVFTGDFKGDGKSDIGLRNIHTGQFFFRLSNGNGGFLDSWPAFQWTGDELTTEQYALYRHLLDGIRALSKADFVDACASCGGTLALGFGTVFFTAALADRLNLSIVSGLASTVNSQDCGDCGRAFVEAGKKLMESHPDKNTTGGRGLGVDLSLPGAPDRPSDRGPGLGIDKSLPGAPDRG